MFLFRLRRFYAAFFTCGSEAGFRVFCAQPLEQKQNREFEDGGVGQVEMLWKSNFLALIGGGRLPKFPVNKAIIWDDRKNKAVVEMTFKSEVRGVRLRRDRVVVALNTRVSVFTFTQTPQQLGVYKTCVRFSPCLYRVLTSFMLHRNLVRD